MGESGQFVEFSMSPEEIATEDTDSARHVALRKEGFNKPERPWHPSRWPKTLSLLSFGPTRGLCREPAEVN